MCYNSFMRILFEIDTKNYDENASVIKRPSVRGIVVKDNKLLMIYSKKYQYYKFPGGGIEENESHQEALVREILEETGYSVILDSIKPYGQINRKTKSLEETIFYQENFYYICEVNSVLSERKPEPYEIEEEMCAVFVDVETILKVNLHKDHGPKSNSMIDRDSRLVELLRAENIID